MGDEKIFGTDGVRGRAGEGWLAPERVAALGHAIGLVLAKERSAAGAPGKLSALIGHDGRSSAAELEAALGRGLAAAGFEVSTVGLIPTPGLAHLVRRAHFDLGVMLSASHNPAEDNGIKVFSDQGEKLSEETEARIEAALATPPEGTPVGPLPSSVPELAERYVELLVRGGPELAGTRVVIDCANGAASAVGPRVLRELGADVVALNAAPDGSNINRGCGSTSPEALQRAVLEHGAAIGIALDGDADRCLVVDELGRLIDGDGILTLIARHAMQTASWSDARVVATVMSNRGLHRALRDVGVKVATVGVGDRHVTEALRKDSLPLGGEQSGHVVFGADHEYIGDGLYTALRVLRVLRESGAELSELAAAFQAFPQVLQNVQVREKPDWATLPEVQAAVRAAEEQLGEDGRVLLRYSGTEPLARVMVEGPDADTIRAHAAAIAGRVADAIGGA